MKPIAVFQHTEVGAPGTVLPILASLGRTVELIPIVAGAAVPTDARRFAGLVFMGGYMSVHDDYPWIAQELALIRQADQLGIPLAGHCLGSQLIALALGGTVVKHSRPEIGWQPLQTEGHPIAQEWWGEFAGQEVETFQWHGDTFTPAADAEAVQLASSIHCSNQAYVLRERHLLVQSHLEMTPELVQRSEQQNGHQLQRQYALGNPAVCPPETLLQDLDERTAQMQRILSRLYSRWVQGCVDDESHFESPAA